MSSEIAHLHELYRCSRTSPAAMVGEHLVRAKRMHDRVNAFTSLFPARALAEARASAARFGRGSPRSLLDGVPITVQDLLPVRDDPSSGRLRSDRPPADAAVVARLRSLGAVVVGKTRMAQVGDDTGSEEAMGNPWAGTDGRRVGGGAAAISIGIGFACLGVDAGGSLRRPAAWCGTVGFKPTQGVLSTAGAVPLSPTLDHTAVVTRRVADARVVFEALVPKARRRASRRADTPLRIGTITVPGLSPAVVRLRDEVLARLTHEGAEIIPVDGVPLLTAGAAALTLMYAEAQEMHGPLLAAHWQRYSPSLRNRVLAAAAVRAVDYVRARAVRTALRAQWPGILQRFGVELLALPTVPSGAPADDHLALTTDDQTDAVLYTSPFDLLGVPAVTVPIGRDEAGLPVGLQVAGTAGDDQRVLDAADRIEAVRGSWSPPPGFADPLSVMASAGSTAAPPHPYEGRTVANVMVTASTSWLGPTDPL